QNPSSLTLNSDKLDMNVGGLVITGIGAGADIKGTSTNAGGIDCEDRTIVPISVTTSNFHYIGCNFLVGGGEGHIGGNVLQSGQPQTFDLNVNLTGLSKTNKGYGIDFNNTTTPQQFILYPFIDF